MTRWRLVFCTAWLAVSLALAACAAPVSQRRPAGAPADQPMSADVEFAQLMSGGRVAYDRGLIEQAAGLYQQALQRARLMDVAAAIGDAAYNLAACRIRLGQLDPAHALLAEAKAEIASIHGNIADVQLVQAKLARLQGSPDAALMFADQVLSGPGSNPSDGHRLEVYLLRGEIACDRKDANLAARELQTAATYADRAADTTLLAGLSRLAGRIHLLKKEPIMAAQAFDREASLLRHAEQYAQMMHALKHAAEAYLLAGNDGLAADRFFRTARSLFAQGELAAAGRLAQRSLAAAEKAGDQPAMARATALLAEIKTRTDSD